MTLVLPIISMTGATRARRAAATLSVVAALLCTTQATAFEYDRPSRPAAAMSLRHDSLLDTVDHAPNSDEGGFESARSRQRFSATRLRLDSPGRGRGSASATLGSYRLVTLRDDLHMLGLHSQARWRLSARTSSQRWQLIASLSSNRASAFDKNSYTSVDGATLTRTRIASPRDVQGSLGLSVGHGGLAGLASLADIRFSGFARLGATRVRHDNVSGTGRDRDGCRYDVEASNQGALIELAEPCGRILSYSETHVGEQGLADRYGIAPSQDLDWQAVWLETGAAAGWSGERFSASLGYRYRLYRRDGIDERIEAAGGQARRAAHVFSFEAAWNFTSRVSLSTGIDYRVAPWLDDLPILYNRFTAERQDTQLPSFQLTLTTRFGR